MLCVLHQYQFHTEQCHRYDRSRREPPPMMTRVLQFRQAPTDLQLDCGCTRRLSPSRDHRSVLDSLHSPIPEMRAYGRTEYARRRAMTRLEAAGRRSYPCKSCRTRCVRAGETRCKHLHEYRLSFASSYITIVVQGYEAVRDDRGYFLRSVWGRVPPFPLWDFGRCGAICRLGLSNPNR